MTISCSLKQNWYIRVCHICEEETTLCGFTVKMLCDWLKALCKLFLIIKSWLLVWYSIGQPFVSVVSWRIKQLSAVFDFPVFKDLYTYHNMFLFWRQARNWCYRSQAFRYSFKRDIDVIRLLQWKGNCVNQWGRYEINKVKFSE